MSLYDEPGAAPAPAGEGELVVPDYTAEAAKSSAPTAMGSDGTMLTGGGGPAAAGAAGAGLAKLYLITVPPDALATDKQKAAALAELQTIVYNVAIYLCAVMAFHTLMALLGYITASGDAEPTYGIKEDLGDWLVIAYIIVSVAGMGYFGAKHCDKHLLLAFTIACTLWFIFMGAENLETIGKYFNLDCDETQGAGTECHRQPWEKEICQHDDLCSEDKIKYDLKHPFAEILPDFVLTVLLGFGVFFGFKLYSSPCVDTNARRVSL